MKLRSYIAVSTLCFALNVNAQQVPMYNSFFYKPFIYNPAMAGDKEMTEAVILNRNMYSNFQGSPLTNFASVDGALQKNKAYAGGVVAVQRKGLINNINAFGTYSYRANFADEVYLKLGLSLGVIDQTINYSQIAVANYSDPNLYISNQRKTSLDGNAGFSFHAKGLCVGFAVPQLTGSKLNYIENTTTRSFYQQSRHYMASLQYEIPLNRDQEMYITPYGLVRIVSNAPLQYDGGLNFNWKDKFWIGGSYKSDYAVGINAGITLNRRFSVGYSYDYMINNIAKYAGVSHELMLGFKFGKLKPRKGEDTLTPQDKKIIDLQKQIDELKKNGVKAAENKSTASSGNTTNTNSSTTTKFQGKNAIKENGVFILSNKASDFTLSDGSAPQTGYYVVTESVFYKDYATQEAKRYVSFGFPEADYLLDKASKFHYIFVFYASTKEDAMFKVADTKAAGVPDAWIQILTD